MFALHPLYDISRNETFRPPANVICIAFFITNLQLTTYQRLDLHQSPDAVETC